MPFRLISRNLVGSCTSVPIPAAVLTITGRWTFSSRKKRRATEAFNLSRPGYFRCRLAARSCLTSFELGQAYGPTSNVGRLIIHGFAAANTSPNEGISPASNARPQPDQIQSVGGSTETRTQRQKIKRPKNTFLLQKKTRRLRDSCSIQATDKRKPTIDSTELKQKRRPDDLYFDCCSRLRPMTDRPLCISSAGATRA